MKQLTERASDALMALLRQGELVLLRRVFRSGQVTYEPLPRLLAEMTMGQISVMEPEVARAKIVTFKDPESYGISPEQVGAQKIELKSGGPKRRPIRSLHSGPRHN